MGTIKMKLEPELGAISQYSYQDFAILIQLNGELSDSSKTHRQPLDLIAVLDVSSSMGGSRLPLLKKSMNFIIQNLTSSDRLSVISFSKIATRNLPLCAMDQTNQTLAINAVNSLEPEKRTNIAAGLREAVETFREDKMKTNAVRSIILFSDGQDNQTLRGDFSKNYDLLIPKSIRKREWISDQDRIAIHTFGFGYDHDANALAWIAGQSGGTFSFIESGDKIQDSFAFCVGGLISIVAKDILLTVKCNSEVCLSSIESGSYVVQQSDDHALVHVGDLYGDEERRFVVRVHVPQARGSSNETTDLLGVKCKYMDTVSNSIRSEAQDVSVRRPRSAPSNKTGSTVVNSEIIRYQVGKALESARDSAERGFYGEAVERLVKANELTKSSSQDEQMTRLSSMLRRMQINVADAETYERTGRAYLVSELSSQRSQRSSSSSQSFGRTRSSIDMVDKSPDQVLPR